MAADNINYKVAILDRNNSNNELTNGINVVDALDGDREQPIEFNDLVKGNDRSSGNDESPRQPVMMTLEEDYSIDQQMTTKRAGNQRGGADSQRGISVQSVGSYNQLLQPSYHHLKSPSSLLELSKVGASGGRRSRANNSVVANSHGAGTSSTHQLQGAGSQPY